MDRILSDITYQSADNLVDGLTKIEEEGYNYAHYYGAGSHKTYKDDYKYVVLDISSISSPLTVCLHAVSCPAALTI